MFESTRNSSIIRDEELQIDQEDAVAIEAKRIEVRDAIIDELKELDAEQVKTSREIFLLLGNFNMLNQKVDSLMKTVYEKNNTIDELRKEIAELNKKYENNFNDIITTKNSLHKEIEETFDSLRDELKVQNNTTTINESIIESLKPPTFSCSTFDDNYKYKPIKFLNDVKRYLDANPQTAAQLI